MSKTKKRQIVDYLNDILESISDIREFIGGMTQEDFVNDKKTINAVIRSLEVIGEAARNIPDTLTVCYPDIAWREIISIRNKLSHEYFGIDLDIVWQSTQEDLQPLEVAIRHMLSSVQ